MENLRWILIFAGVAILMLLYFSGRSAGGASRNTDRRSRPPRARDLENGLGLEADSRGGDPLLGTRGGAGFDAAAGYDADHAHGHDAESGYDHFVVDPNDLERPGGAHAPRDFELPGVDHGADHELSSGSEPGAGARGAGHRGGYEPLPPELADGPRTSGLASSAAGAVGAAAGAFGGLSQRIEAIGAKLSPKRHERIAASEPDDAHDDAPAFASKIITLHVVAREGATFDGQALLDCFERRELTFGEMNIFHSMHHEKTVFSVAKMVEPGWFDPHDLDSFATPGITLILQLPGPVAADTAFEVLLSEAFEIARELDGTVLDGERSTLSKQTAQHMREGIYEYMHRQKYFGSVAS